MVDESRETNYGNRITPQESESTSNYRDTLINLIKLGRFDIVSGFFLFLPILYSVVAIAMQQVREPVGILEYLRFDPLNLVAIYSAVFSFLAIRQMIKNRESGSDPTLFVDTNEQSFRLLNLGNGPAHNLGVSYATRSKNDERDVEDLDYTVIERNENCLIRVNEILNMGLCVEDIDGEADSWDSVTFQFIYSTNLGTDKGPIYRTIEHDVIGSNNTSESAASERALNDSEK